MNLRTHSIICLFGLLSFFILAMFSGCDRDANKPLQVSLEKKELQKSATPKSEKESLRIAIAAVVSPKETFLLYKDLLDYIAQEMQMEVKLIQRETYAEVNNLVRDNELDLAFVCSGAYVDGHDQFGMELLAAPIAYGEAVYHSYIIVPADSPVTSIEDLRGKSFAFTDPMSNTGKLSPTYLLAQMNEDPKSFFSSTVFTYSHDRSIEMVAYKLVDGAAVDSLIWEYINVKNPELTKLTRIIYRSEPYGIPPVVIPASMDPAEKNRIRNLLLNIHQTPKGREILGKLMIERFVRVEDKDYDSVRTMRDRFKK